MFPPNEKSAAGVLPRLEGDAFSWCLRIKTGKAGGVSPPVGGIYRRAEKVVEDAWSALEAKRKESGEPPP
jgi:hypothetical protein